MTLGFHSLSEAPISALTVQDFNATATIQGTSSAVANTSEIIVADSVAIQGVATVSGSIEKVIQDATASITGIATTVSLSLIHI